MTQPNERERYLEDCIPDPYREYCDLLTISTPDGKPIKFLSYGWIIGNDEFGGLTNRGVEITRNVIEAHKDEFPTLSEATIEALHTPAKFRTVEQIALLEAFKADIERFLSS